MDLTIAEQLHLLLYRPDGSADGDGSTLAILIKLDVALAGALLSELVEDGYAEFAEGKVHAVAVETEPDHPRMRSALARLAKKPRKPEKAVQVLAKRLRKGVRTDLIASGVLRRQGRGLKGARYELIEPGLRDALNDRLRAVLFESSPLDRDLRLLIPVLATARLSNRVLVGEDPAEVARRLRRMTEKSWLVEGLRRAVIGAWVQAGLAFVTEIVIPVVAVVTR